jgi:hypothetical protein
VRCSARRRWRWKRRREWGGEEEVVTEAAEAVEEEKGRGVAQRLARAILSRAIGGGGKEGGVVADSTRQTGISLRQAECQEGGRRSGRQACGGGGEGKRDRERWYETEVDAMRIMKMSWTRRDINGQRKIQC